MTEHVPPAPTAARRRRGRRAALAAAALVGLAGVAYGVELATAPDTVPAGVRVGATPLGGLTPAEAAAAVEAAYAPLTLAAVPVTADGRPDRLDPREAGLGLDVAATVGRAADPGLLPWRRWRARFGESRIDPVVTVDREALGAALDRLAERVGDAPVHAAVVYDGTTPTVREPRDGRAVDAGTAEHRLREQWLDPDRQRARRGADGPAPVALPVTPQAGRGTREQVEAALPAEGRRAVAAPVVLAVGGEEVEVAPPSYAPHLALEVGPDGALRPEVDGVALREALTADPDQGLAAVETAPVDAAFDTSTGSVRVVPSRAGRTVAPGDLASALESAVLAPPPRRAEAPLTSAVPALTTAAARSLGVVERVSTFTTEHPCCAPRVTNIQRIADLLDGHLVMPGEEFSLNDTVGERTRANGFVAAPQILEGRFTDGVGGGISQFTTTLFNAVFFAGLEDVQHTPHSYYISRYPPGRESTVSWPEPDFRFRNDSAHAVLVDTSYTRTSITVSFWSTKRYDVTAETGPRRAVRGFETVYDPDPGCQPMSGGQGFDITVTRVFAQEGREVRREEFDTRYQPQPRVLCQPRPRPSPSPAPAPSRSPSPSPAAPADGAADEEEDAPV